jgi:chromosome partitioning protein
VITSIAFTNRKGGSWKSTGTVVLGVALAALGHRTVMLDCDTEQGSLAVLLDMVDSEGRIDDQLGAVLAGELSIADALRPVDVAKLPIIEGITPAPLDLVPGWLKTADVLRAIEADPLKFKIANTLTVFRRALSGLPSDVEYVLFDLAPSHRLMTAGVFMASDYLIIPTLTDYLSLNAVMEALAALDVYQQENPRLRVLGIVPTLTRKGTLNYDTGMYVLRERYSPWLMSEIPYRTIWGQAAWDRQTVLTYEKGNIAAEEAWNFVDEVLDRLEVKQHAHRTRTYA